jgi:hypothetical protein
MRDMSNEMINGRGYTRCTLEQGDSLEAVCLYFNYPDWLPIYNLPINDFFKQTHPASQQGSFDFSDNPIFYVPAQSGSSGQASIVRLDLMETYCRQIEILERVESNSLRMVTYIRKLYYDSPPPGWDSIIPGARDINMPISTSPDPSIAMAIRYIRENQILPVDGRWLDIGHFFTGLDAKNHPQQPLVLGVTIEYIQQYAQRRLGTSIDIQDIQRRLGSELNIRQDTTVPILTMRDNQMVATWSPDIGSAAVEFLHGRPRRGAPRRVEPRASGPHALSFDHYYDMYSSNEDMRGNADSYVFPFDNNQRLSQQFRSYYITNPNPRRQRFTRFRQILAIQDNESWKGPARTDVLNSALGYAQGAGYMMDVAAVIIGRTIGRGLSRRALDIVMQDAGLSRLDVWDEAYRAGSRIAVDTFVRRMTQGPAF